jgi:hypothetical protein
MQLLATSERWSAWRWISRIMISWGLVTIGMAFTNYAIIEAEIARHSQGCCGKIVAIR